MMRAAVGRFPMTAAPGSRGSRRSVRDSRGAMKNLLSHTATHDATADMLFREQCRRQLARPLEVRMKYGFCRISRPGFDEPAVRVFETTRA